MGNDAIRTFNRFELKYVVRVRELARLREEIAAYMVRDPHAGADGRYTLTSLYYDTRARDCFWAKLDGLRFRRKLRIRHYEQREVVTDDTIVYVEIKQRVDRVTQKRRALHRFPEWEVDYENIKLAPTSPRSGASWHRRRTRTRRTARSSSSPTASRSSRPSRSSPARAPRQVDLA